MVVVCSQDASVFGGSAVCLCMSVYAHTPRFKCAHTFVRSNAKSGNSIEWDHFNRQQIESYERTGRVSFPWSHIRTTELHLRALRSTSNRTLSHAHHRTRIPSSQRRRPSSHFPSTTPAFRHPRRSTKRPLSLQAPFLSKHLGPFAHNPSLGMGERRGT